MASEYTNFPRQAIKRIEYLSEKNSSPKAKSVFEQIISGLEEIESKVDHSRNDLLKKAYRTKMASEAKHEVIGDLTKNIFRHASFLEMLDDYFLLTAENNPENIDLVKYFDSEKLENFLNLCGTYKTVLGQYENVLNFSKKIDSMNQDESYLPKEQVDLIEQSVENTCSLFEDQLQGFKENFSVSRNPNTSRMHDLQEKIDYLRKTFPRMEIDGKTVKKHMQDVIIAWAQLSYQKPERVQQRKKSFELGGGKPLWKSTRTGRLMDLVQD